MKNCDTCQYFVKVKEWSDGRKGLCDYTDYNIKNMKGNCKYYKSKKYKRIKKVLDILKKIIIL